MSGNSADFGGGIYNGSSNATLKSTIVANNTPGGDCAIDLVISAGYNLDSDDTCGFDQDTDLPDIANPLLGPLQDNGGPTETHALLPGSPAIDQIPDDDCTDSDGHLVDTDQRGVDRPMGAGCDI